MGLAGRGIAVCSRRVGSAPPSKYRRSIIIYDIVPSHLTIGSGSQESNRIEFEEWIEARAYNSCASEHSTQQWQEAEATGNDRNGTCHKSECK
jgi:hypothetical protein